MSVPGGLLNAHRTKVRTWGKIVALEGQLLSRILQTAIAEYVLNLEYYGVVEPELLHEVEPMGKVSFKVEFHK